jgi:hypothetical protein
MDWNIKDDTVQGYWNEIENKILNAVDVLVPMNEFVNNYLNNQPLPARVRNYINKRKILLKRNKMLRSGELRMIIKDLDKQIRNYFNGQKTKRVRKAILPNNTSSLWKAVRFAKDLNQSNMPKTI